MIFLFSTTEPRVALSVETVAACASTLTTDVASPMVLRMVARAWGKQLDSCSASFRFGPEDAAAFYKAHGWRVVEYHAAVLDAQRLHREFPFAWLFRLLRPSMWRDEMGRTRGPMSGVLLLENAKSEG